MSDLSSDRLRFDEKWVPVPESGCWLWTDGVYRTGYGRFRIGTKQHGAHRVAWMLYRGQIPAGKLVCHKCDVKCCVNPDHLYVGTHLDNNGDTSRRGRWRGHEDVAGSKNPNAKLTEADVVRIRTDGRPQAEIAGHYEVSQTTVSDIKLGRRWRHIA